MQYEFLEHTADAKFRAYGSTLEETFINAARAMCSIMINPGTVQPNEVRMIEVSGSDEKSLLYNFLEEFLFLLDSEGFLLSEIEELHIGEGKLTATLKGDKSDDYQLDGDIKAVTYNEMEIKKGKKVMVQVVVDI